MCAETAFVVGRTFLNLNGLST